MFKPVFSVGTAHSINLLKSGWGVRQAKGNDVKLKQPGVCRKGSLPQGACPPGAASHVYNTEVLCTMGYIQHVLDVRERVAVLLCNSI